MQRKQSWVSPARFAPYLVEADQDEGRAWQLYEWNARVAAALWECIHHAEVLLRNAMMGELSKLHPLSYPWNSDLKAVRETAATQGTKEHPAGPDDIIAGLTLGFWQQFLEKSPANDELWRHHLRNAFPGSPGRRDVVRQAVADMRNLRNRCGHQDSLLEADPGIEVKKILTLVGWIDPDAREWLAEIERASDIASERPIAPPRDVLVVPVAKEEGMAMYAAHQAYVCPQERSFAPVQHMGFYSEQKILEYFPKITSIQVPSLWSKEEAKRLQKSIDPDEKRLGGVMSYGLKNGWTTGNLYQVFLLTKKDDAETEWRPSKSPIEHLRRGRGSAFVHRHRYFTKASLMAANNTEQL